MLGSSSYSSEEDQDRGLSSSLDLSLPPPRFIYHTQQLMITSPTLSSHQPPIFSSFASSSPPPSLLCSLPPPPSSYHPRQLLITCAELISRCDFSSVTRLITLLSSEFASPSGDSIERLVYHFCKALSLRIQHHFASPSCISFNPSTSSLTLAPPTTSTLFPPLFTTSFQASPPQSPPPQVRFSSYLTLNQITPFVRFTHLTANQAILEAVEGYKAVHILDMDIMHGVQWPPLLQAIMEKSSTLACPLPMIRITGGGQDPILLQRTGDRLIKFAQTLGLDFHFHCLELSPDLCELETLVSTLQEALEKASTALAVNCGHFLHRLLREYDTRSVRRFLHMVNTLSPRVLTVGESEAEHNHPLFMRRFSEALDHYGAVFDSLEATLPPHSEERAVVENGWFGEEIKDVVGKDGEGRKERHQKYESWEVLLRSSGFKCLPLSPFSLSQAKLLLRLHYPSEGYQLQVLHTNCLLLGWKNRPLFSVSSWQ